MDLDDAYANAPYIPDGESYPDRWAQAAEAFRETGLIELDLPYGESLRQRLDIFHPNRMARGTVVFVHGGYWKAFGKSWFSHLAAGPLLHGWAVVMPSYDLCPEVGVPEITRQIAAAVDMVAQRLPGPIRLTGHSAGGHLVARMLDPALPLSARPRIEGVVPISPVADLAPLLRTSMNEVLGLTPETAKAESPIFQPAPAMPVTVWVGGAERPAFLEQAEALATAWDCAQEVVPERHHFDVIEALADPESDLTARVVGLC